LTRGRRRAGRALFLNQAGPGHRARLPGDENTRHACQGAAMRRLYTGNAHRLGLVLAAPMLAIAFLLLIFQDHNKLLFVLSFLVLAGLMYGGVVLLQFIDKALVERRQGRR
jgi:hypothetical protein